MKCRHISPSHRGSAWWGRVCSQTVHNQLRATAETRTAPFLDLWVFLEWEYHSCSIHLISVSYRFREIYAGRRFWAWGGVHFGTLTLHVAHAYKHMLHDRGSDHFTCVCSRLHWHEHETQTHIRENETLAMRSRQTRCNHVRCHCAPSA